MSETDLKPKTTLLQWSEEDVERILKQYNRRTADLKVDVAIVRAWLKTQLHLPLQPSDRQIVYFLILNKFSIEKTKIKLEMNYSIKSILPEYFSIPPGDPRIEASMKAFTFIPLPKLSRNCNRILINKCENPDTFNFCHFINCLALLFELRTIYDISNSDDLVIDCGRVNLTLVSKMSNIVELKKCISIWEKVYSSRIFAIHIIRLPKLGENFVNFLLGLLKTKIKGRVYYHKSVEELWEHYPKEILPKEMGGTKPLEEMNREWLEMLRENNDYLEKVGKARIKEKLRPKILPNDDFMGYHGSFKKLEID